MSLSLAKKDIYVYTETIPNISIIYSIYGNIYSIVLVAWTDFTRYFPGHARKTKMRL
jgi:hypothetical protein